MRPGGALMDALRYRAGAGDQGPPGWRLLWVARADGEPGLVVQRSAHRHCSISYIEAGHGVVRIEGVEERLGPGDAFILPRGVDHELRYDRARPWRQLFAAFAGELPGQLLQAYGLERVHAFREAPIAQPLRNLLGHDGDDRELQLRAGAALNEILAVLHRRTYQVPDLPQVVLRAKAYIDDHLEHGPTVAEVAQRVGCSPAHLSRSFRRHLGCSTATYRLRRRMDLARVLLATTDLPIKAIADRLAYQDSFGFSHAFKAAFGCAPSTWRRQVLEGRRAP